MKKAFERTCMACNAKKNKFELLRIVRKKTGEILLDKTGKINARGAYICNDIKCLEKIIKTKRIEKILKSRVEQKIYEDIRGVIIDSHKSE